MSVGYRAVQWSPGKRAYDAVLVALLGLYLAAFLGVTFIVRPELTVETAVVRAFGTAALLLLHVVLAIGPLTRLDRRFLPLLWNRRHLGVTMFVCALTHGAITVVQFHAQGISNPLVSLLASNSRYGSLAQFPFQPLGFAALAVLFLMAATSHDFWLANLTAPVWKALHMGVYLAYALIVAHVALGVLQDERSPLLVGVLALGAAVVLGLHLAAAAREHRTDSAVAATEAGGWVEVGRVDQIGEGRAKVVSLSGERIAVFRHGGKISVVSNVCQHQNGPLGEGRILDGCFTCPWHGYQYRPSDGRSPEPFTESVPTFRVTVIDRRILVDPHPLPPGTLVEPATFDRSVPSAGDSEAFFVGYLRLPESLRGFLGARIATLALAFAALGGLVAAQQRPLGSGEFEYGIQSQFEGVLRLDPVPALWTVKRAGSEAAPASSEGETVTAVPLVGVGKHGPPAAIFALAGREIRATGSWIRRGPERLFEIAAAEVLENSTDAYRILAGRFGPVTMRGEIVDSKCFLGVMKPGEGKSHRACAALCLAGGVRRTDGERRDGGSLAGGLRRSIARFRIDRPRGGAGRGLRRACSPRWSDAADHRPRRSAPTVNRPSLPRRIPALRCA